LVIKGLLSPEDVRIAVDCGVDGVILSNHGGRTLDYAIAPLAILPEIAAKGYKIPLMIDGGIRRGTDVLKALALGAAFAFVGRPFMYALAAGGIAGVGRVAELLKEEIDRDMALLGVTRLDQVSSACLRREDA
jgi:L-lactate dehydrogenase (cytochrome)